MHDLLMDFIFDLSEGQQALIMFGSMVLMIVLAVENAHGRSRRGFVQANQQRVGYSGGDEAKENRGYFFFEECERYVLEVARVSERTRQDVVEVGQKSE